MLIILTKEEIDLYKNNDERYKLFGKAEELLDKLDEIREIPEDVYAFIDEDSVSLKYEYWIDTVDVEEED